MGWHLRGDFTNTLKILNKYYRINGKKNLTRASERVCEVLARETPVETGETANAWYFEIKREHGNQVSEIKNSAHADETRGRCAPVAVLLDTGHGTGTGGYVPGSHYITRTIDSTHDETIDEIKAVIKDGR